MRFNKKNILYLLASFVFLMNLIAGGVLPFGQDQTKDLIKVFLIFFNLIVLYFFGIKTKEFKVVSIYFVISGVLLFLSFFRTEEIVYSLEKVDAILFCVPFSTFIILALYNRVGLNGILRLIIKCGLLLLILTVIYKLIFGFWDRDTRFFLNGANVFGWLMGLYFLASVYVFSLKKEKLMLVLSLIFFLGVLWSGSKGALLSSLMCFLLIVFTQSSNLKLKILFSSSIVIFLVFNEYFEMYLQSNFPQSRLLAIFRIFNGNTDESDEGSVGVRGDLLAEAFKFFIHNPIFGIGLGNFKFYSVYGFDYPHNAHVEIFAENGLIIGLIYTLWVLYGLVISKGFLRILIIYFLVTCSFSGDLSYLRFAFIFILLSLCLRNSMREEISSNMLKVAK